jgi:hypothetical protein
MSCASDQSISDEEFYLKVAQALSGCQLIEQELKLYITEAFDLVRKCLGNKMTFKLSGGDYADTPLGRLIDAFSKLHDNGALVTELRAFNTERNFLTHRAIAHCLDYEGELAQTTAIDMQDRLSEIQAKAVELRTALHEEANKFRGYLWFDDLDNHGSPS